VGILPIRTAMLAVKERTGLIMIVATGETIRGSILSFVSTRSGTTLGAAWQHCSKSADDSGP